MSHQTTSDAELKRKYVAWVQAEANQQDDECEETSPEFPVKQWEWLEEKELCIRGNHYLLCMQELLTSPRWNLGESVGRSVVEATLRCIGYLKTSEGKKKTSELLHQCPSMIGSTAGGSAWAMCDAACVMDALLKEGLLYDAVCDTNGVLYALGGVASRKVREGRAVSYACTQDPRSEFTFGCIAEELVKYNEAVKSKEEDSGGVATGVAQRNPRVAGTVQKISRLGIVEECLVRIDLGVAIDGTVCSMRKHTLQKSGKSRLPKKRKVGLSNEQDDESQIKKDADFTAELLREQSRLKEELKSIGKIQAVKRIISYLVDHSVDDTVKFAEDELRRVRSYGGRCAPSIRPRIHNFCKGLRSMKWSHGNRPYFALLRATDLSDGDIYRLSDGVRFSKSELPSEALVIELPRFWKKNASDGGCYPVVALSKEWANTNQSCVSKPKDCFAPTSPHVLPGVVRPETGIDPLRPRGNSATSPRRSPHSLTVLERIKRLSGLKVQDRESYATAWTWSCKRPDLRDNLFQETGPAEARSCGDEQLKRLLEVLRESRKSYLQEAPTARF